MNPLKDLTQSLSIALATFILGTSLPHLLPAADPKPPDAATTQQNQQHTPDPKTRTPAEFPEASLEEVLDAQENSSALLVDARPAAFYNLGHIPKAINLPPDDSHPPLKHERLKPPTPLIIYCSNRDCPDSLKVAQNLSTEFPNIRLFKDGWDVWEILGLPTEKTP
jgi:hypothetical protein